MKAAIDTNRLTDFFRGDPATLEVVQSCRHLFVPFIVLAEMRCGLLGERESLKNARLLSELLTSAHVGVLFPDEDTTHHYAQIFVQLRRQGRPIPTNDIWIAALCVQNDLPLLTRDQHFLAIPQLQCL